MDIYNEWSEAWNKDDLKFYDSEEFRREYTERDMDSKARMFEQQALDEVQAALRYISCCTDRNRIRVLSLGCGPGSDLLGLLGAVDSALRSGDEEIRWEDGELKCSCTGVDAFDWDREEFEQRLDNLYQTGDLGRISYRFKQQNMESFVLSCFDSDTVVAKEFDFICLSFADAGRNLELIGSVVPRLLSQFGRVIVLDNNIPTVRRLAEFGYTCTASNVICTHIRGRSEQRTLGTYRQQLDSPIRRYRQEAEARLQERRKREEMRQLSRAAKLFKQQAQAEVQTALRSIWRRTDRNRIRVLSLGCGPGSDLLGLLGAVDSALRSGDAKIGWEDDELKCSCTGVDDIDCNWDALEQRLDNLYQTGYLGRIRYKFKRQDMQSFVLSCFDSSSSHAITEFDFICLSFADAGRNLELIGSVVSRLLSKFGRVIVLDKDTRTLRKLTEYGYTRTSVGNGICSYSRGRSEHRMRLVADSPRGRSAAAQDATSLSQEELDRLQEEVRLLRLEVKRLIM